MEKILIIDDEKIIRDRFKKFFTRHQYEVFLAADGKEGIEMVKKEKPDLIVLDLKMPEMDGIEALKRIKVSDKDIEKSMQAKMKALVEKFTKKHGMEADAP